MQTRLPLLALAGFLLAAPGCGDSTDPNPPPSPAPACSSLVPTTLSPGGSVVLDAEEAAGCVRIPAAGADGAEHLYVPLATSGEITEDGVSGGYRVRGGEPAVAAPEPLPSPLIGGFAPPAAPDAFHAGLRAAERELARRGAPFAAPPARPAPPSVGDERTFSVCASTTCQSFVQVAATAKVVGQSVAIYLDDEVPAGGYTDQDLADIAALFDADLYPIDTTAFGRESDRDGNDVVIVLLTDAVNALSGSCNTTGRIVLGYFYGLDLLSGTGSNGGEIFYALVPDPTSTTCTVSRENAVRRLGPTFIHEFQHMISFNQHVLLRDGAAEDTWLNEGLSHLAEELGGRLADGGTRWADFTLGTLLNAYGYLETPELHFMVSPGSSTGTLAERGADWLFVRWLADHFGAPAPLGTSLTRALVQTGRTGAANVAAVTGQPFGHLVAQWQLANWVDDLPGFTPADGRLRYLSWNLRRTYDSLHTAQPAFFPRAYPLEPLQSTGVGLARSGVLRAGSGPFVRLIQPASAAALDLQLTDSSGALISGALDPRIAVVRIR